MGTRSSDPSFSLALENRHLLALGALNGSFPRKRNKNDGETLSSEQVILGISHPLVAPRPSRLSSFRPRASMRTSSNTTGHPLARCPHRTRAASSRGLNGCRTDCFLFRASVPRPLFPRVAVPRGNDKQMSAVVYNGCWPPPRRHGDATWRSTFLTRRRRRRRRRRWPLGDAIDAMCNERNNLRQKNRSYPR